MKNVLKRIATVASVMALIVVTSICMTACGGGNDNTKNTNPCNIDNLNGFYANIENGAYDGIAKLYYFYKDDNGELKYKHGEFSLSEEPGDNGLYKLTVKTLGTPDDLYHSNELEINRNNNCSVYKVWNSYGYKTLLISSQNENSQDLSQKFYAQDDELIYGKFSSLTEFFADAFPLKDIDRTDMQNVSHDWESLLLAA